MTARRHTRLDHLARFEKAAADGDSNGLASRVLFLVLWELPAMRQLALPESLVVRSLPGFESKHPRLGLRGLLERAHGEQPPHVLEVAQLRPAPDEAGFDKADRFLVSAVKHICEGAARGAAPETVTSAAIAATQQAIGALAAQAWIDDDPEAAVNEERFHSWLATRASPLEPCPVPLRPMNRSRAARDAERSAWRDVIQLLRAADLAQCPEIQDRTYLARCIRRSYGDFFLVLYPGEVYRAPPSPGLRRSQHGGE